MLTQPKGQFFEGLERSCDAVQQERIAVGPGYPGIERIEACFRGAAFEPHRHDTYALGVTLHGVQAFHYRGGKRYSTRGRIIVLHPDEVHDGGAATDAGLRYRMLYLEPALLQQADCIAGNSLPFVKSPVIEDGRLRDSLMAALDPLDEPLDDLLADDLIAEIAGGLIRHANHPAVRIGSTHWRAAERARTYLAENATKVVRSAELERTTGLGRFALSRHFRAAFGTSPYRFLLMRRLQHARDMIAAGAGLAETAAASGFADQSHLQRHFKQAFGMTPGRWAGLVSRRG